jgi:hypothetical protein
MAKDAELFLKQGEIQAIGTANQKIQFVQDNPPYRWKWIRLNSGGSDFEHVVFDGGERNVYVTTRPNSFRHIQSQNALTGFYSWWTWKTKGDLGDFEMHDSYFTNNRWSAITLYHSNGEIYNTVIEENDDGLSINDGELVFHGNTVQNNGQDDNERGFRVGNEGVLKTYFDYYEPYGRNVIRNNDNAELHFYSGGLGYIGECGQSDWHGRNSISNTQGGELIWNDTGSLICAEDNYWGSGGPSASDFDGPVDYQPYLTSAPPQSATSGSSLLAGKSTGEGAAPQASTDSSRVPVPPYVNADLRRKIRSVRSDLQNGFDKPDAAVHARRLLYLQHLDAGDHLGERGATFRVLRAASQWLLDGRTAGSSSSTGANYRARASQTAAVLLLRAALLQQNYAEARDLVANFDQHVEDPSLRYEFVLSSMTVREQQGDSDEAVRLLGQASVYAPESNRSNLMKLERQLRSTLRQSERTSKTVSRFDTLLEEGRKEGLKRKMQGSTDSLPVELKISEVFPNPSRSRAFVSVELPEEAQVRADVFDLLGRRVASLFEGPVSAGRTELDLKSQRMSSGSYFVRVTIQQPDGETRTFTRRMTVVR